MKVKNLHDSETFRWCEKLVEEGKYTKSIIIPMKWEIEYELGSKFSAQKFISKLDEIFGESASVSDWPDNYDAPWFFIMSTKPMATMGLFEKWGVVVNLTTDAQLSYMTIAFPDTMIRKERLAA